MYIKKIPYFAISEITKRLPYFLLKKNEKKISVFNLLISR